MSKPEGMDPADVVERAQAALKRYPCQCGSPTCFDANPRELRRLVPELVAELVATRAELALTRDGLDVRPMSECESNLMTQVLDLRRQLAAARGSVGEVQHP